MTTHMKIHKDKTLNNRAAETKSVQLLVKDMMADIIQVAIDNEAHIASKKDQEVDKDLIASAKDKENDNDVIIIASAQDQEDEKVIGEIANEIEIELDLRDIHANMSQRVKEDQSRTKMIPDEDWTKTLNSSDMEEQFEQLSKQLEEVPIIENLVDEVSTTENETEEEFARSCNDCNKKFKWMAQLVKHTISVHRPIDSGDTDPMWFMMGELLAEIRDEQGSVREEMEDFYRGMIQAMKLLTQTLTQDMTKSIQKMLATQTSTENPKIFVCDICGYESKTKYDLNMHVHCTDCNSLIANMEELSKHKQTIHKDKPEEEEDLKKKVMEMETLKIEVDNMKTMLKEQNQEIQIKNAIIESYKDVDKQKIHTMIPVEQVTKKKTEAPKMDKVDEHRCNACNRMFRTNKDLDNHVNAKHKEEPLVVSMQCAICSKEFNTKKDMEIHKRSCMQHVCPTCGEICETRVELQKHNDECAMLKNSNNFLCTPVHSLSFECTPCKKSFRTWDDHMEHMSQIHLTESQREGHGLSKYPGSGYENKSNNAWRPPLCRNGNQCYYHRQNRCNFFHHQPPPRQEGRPHRQAPSSQWQEVPRRRPQVHNRQGVQQPHEPQAQGHRYWSVPPQGVQSVPRCLHGRGCPMGQYCVLRHEDSDFPNLPTQGGQ